MTKKSFIKLVPDFSSFSGRKVQTYFSIKNVSEWAAFTSPFWRQKLDGWVSFFVSTKKKKSFLLLFLTITFPPRFGWWPCWRLNLLSAANIASKKVGDTSFRRKTFGRKRSGRDIVWSTKPWCRRLIDSSLVDKYFFTLCRPKYLSTKCLSAKWFSAKRHGTKKKSGREKVDDSREKAVTCRLFSYSY